MKRWSDYYDSMDPSKKKPQKNPQIDVTRSASVKYFSVYPRKAATEHNASGRVTPNPHPNPTQRTHHLQTTDETSFQGERYTSRPTEFGSVSNRVDAGHTNFAWVD